MPFLLMSKSDPILSQHGEQLAAAYKDHFVYFGLDCFAEENLKLEAKDTPPENQGRITIHVHGDTEGLGDLHYTPKQLYEEFVKRKCPFTKIDKMDFVSCGLGQHKKEVNTNFVMEFADLLYQDPNNRHIKLNYISSSALSEYFEKNILTEMLVNADDRSVKVSCIIPGKQQSYEKELEELAKLPLSPNEFNLRFQRIIRAHSIRLVEYKCGIREILDLHPGFSTDYLTSEKIKSFDSKRLGLFRRINNRMAELKLAEPPPAKKEDLVKELMEMRKEVEDTKNNLDNLAKKFDAFWSPPTSHLQRNQVNYEAFHQHSDATLCNAMQLDQYAERYEQHGRSTKNLKLVDSYDRGLKYFYAKEYGKALKKFKDIEEEAKTPSDNFPINLSQLRQDIAAVRFAIGSQFFHQRKWTEALAQYKSAYDRENVSPAVQSALSEYHHIAKTLVKMGDVYTAQGNDVTALQKYMEAEQKWDYPPPISKKESLSDCKTKIDNAIDNLTTKAYQLLQQKQFSNAMQLYNFLLSQHRMAYVNAPTDDIKPKIQMDIASIHAAMGNIYLAEEKYSDALKKYEEAYKKQNTPPSETPQAKSQLRYYEQQIEMIKSKMPDLPQSLSSKQAPAAAPATAAAAAMLQPGVPRPTAATTTASNTYAAFHHKSAEALPTVTDTLLKEARKHLDAKKYSDALNAYKELLKHPNSVDTIQDVAMDMAILVEGSPDLQDEVLSLLSVARTTRDAKIR